MPGFKQLETVLDFGFVGNIPTTLNSAIEIVNLDGFSTIVAWVTAPTGGEISFELSVDGIHWETAYLWSLKDEIYTPKTSNNESFRGSIAGARKFRFRVSSGGSAQGTVMGRIIREVSTVEGIEFGWPPHRIGFPTIHKDVSYTTAQTGTAIWTPASGKTYHITDASIIVGGTTDGIVTLFDNTDATGNRLFKGAIEVTTNKQFVWDHQLKTTFRGAAADNVLKITTSANITIDVILHGYEV